MSYQPDVIDTDWQDVSGGLVVRSQDLLPEQRLDLVPRVFDALPQQYQTEANYSDLELRARSMPARFDRAVELTGKTIPQLIQHNTYNVSSHHQEDRQIIFAPRINVSAAVNQSATDNGEGRWFWGVLIGFLLLVALLLGES